MGEFTKILKSFSLKDTLNPKIWENADDVESSKMKSNVREALLKIAEKFIDYLGDDAFVEDITLTGSLANFNWSEFSDFDLHIIIDFQQYEKEAKVYQELFDARKYIFNESHDIKIYGYDVELYAQDVEEKHTSTGLYSVLSNEWLQKPKKQSPDIDKKLLVQKIDCWIEKIEKGIKEGKDLDKLKTKLKEYRKSGLEKEGELSYENLVFKFLRRSGHIEKLFDEINKRTDKELSIEQSLTEAPMSGQLFGGKPVKIPKDDAHAGQGNWPSSNAWDIKGDVGSAVYALTSGKVIIFKDYGDKVTKRDGKKLYGESMRVDSEGGLPDVYYTHLKGTTARVGSEIKCGQLIGYIMDFPDSSYDHVHIGVESGHNIRELLNDDGTIKCAKGVKMGSGEVTKDEDDPEKILDASEFLKKMKELAEGKKKFEYTPGMKIPYFKEVELIQTALQFLGFSLPKWGVDGKFGPETQNAVNSFQDEYGITKTGDVSEKELKYLTALLIVKGFKDEDLSSIKKDKEIDTTGVTDKNFYEKLLKELGAPVSDENMKFLYAWRQAEGKAGKYNPFNTTHKMPNSTNFNSVGVKNYQSIEDGLYATIKTLKNGRYNCIVDGLKNDIGAAQIAKCESLKVWGTGDLVAKVVRGYESGSSPKVSSLA